MNDRDLTFSAEGAVFHGDVRARLATALLEHASSIASDAAAIVPMTTTVPVDAEFCRQTGWQVVDLLARTIRDGRLASSGGRLADLHRATRERGLSIEQLFAMVYVIERTVLDSLASSRDFGATTDGWPVVAQLVRRSSFDVLAAYSRTDAESSEAALVDRLTTAYTRSLFDAVLAKELERAARLEMTVAFILFDVDGLSAINHEFGQGVGDRILERIGIMVRQYFRRQDWVARFADDSLAVLLTGTDLETAFDLADKLRTAVQERMTVADHRSRRPIAVTVSAVVIGVPPKDRAIDPERLVANAEAAMARSKRIGRNRVERAAYASRSS